MEKRKLLIVDDEKDIVEIMADLLLSNRDIEIHKAFNGQEALELCKTHHFDAIISDIRMPLMDGLSFLKALRDSGNMVPFIVHTAYGEKDYAVQALKFGAFDFIEKPSQESTIAEVIDRALELGEQLKFWQNQDDIYGYLTSLNDHNTKQAVKSLEKIFSIISQKRNKS